MAPGTYKNVPVRPGSDAEVSQQIQEIDSGSLSAPRSFDLTPAPPATGTDGALAALEATSASFTGDLAERARQREASFNQSSDQYLRALLDTQGQTTLQDAAYRDTVDPAETELKDINQQMLEEQHSLRRRLEVFDKNAAGVVGESFNDMRRDIQNESLSRQADLAVIQLSKQGKFDSAKAIADRAVAAKMEQQRTVLEALQFNYQNNKDLFTTAEQRSFETMLGDRNRELDQEAKMEMARFEQTIRQSDPLYQAQLANARSSGGGGAGGGSTGGGGAGAFVSQPGYGSLSAGQQGKATAINDIITQLNSYRAAYDANVDSTGKLLTGEAAAKLQAEQASLMFALAQAVGTGALQEADRAVLEKVIPNPTSASLFGSIGTWLRGGKDGGLGKIDSQIDKFTTSLTDTYGLQPTQASSAAGGDPLGLGVTPAANPLGL